MMPAPTVIKLKQCTTVKAFNIVLEKKAVGILTYTSSGVWHRLRGGSHRYCHDKFLHRIVGRSGGVVEEIFCVLAGIGFRWMAD